MTIDFKDFALNVARNNEVESLLPVVEKELIHYDIVRALDESNWLSRLTFQEAPACACAMAPCAIARTLTSRSQRI